MVEGGVGRHDSLLLSVTRGSQKGNTNLILV